MSTQRAFSLRAPLLISAVSVAMAGCAGTSSQLAQREPKYVADSTLTVPALRDCLMAGAPEIFKVVELSNGYRLINGAGPSLTMVLDVTATPTGSHVKAYAPGVFLKKRVDRCKA